MEPAMEHPSGLPRPAPPHTTGAQRRSSRANELAHFAVELKGPRKPLTLPLEVLERILSQVFLPPTRTHPFSNPYHLRNTTHLLLVSRAFRQLCLPLFHRTLAITRPSDFITFFHSTDRIFAGSEGLKKWPLVKELVILTGVSPPLLADLPPAPSGPWGIPLAFPTSTHTVDLLCIIDPDPITTYSKPSPTRSMFGPLPLPQTPHLAHLVASAQSDPATIAHTRSPLYAAYAGEAKLSNDPETDAGFEAWVARLFGGQSVDEALRVSIEMTTMTALKTARESAFSQLLKCANPKRLCVPLERSTHTPLFTPSLEGTEAVEVHRYDAGANGRKTDVDVLVRTVGAVMLKVWGNEVTLVEFEGEVKEMVRERLRKPDDGTVARGWDRLRWFWEGEDGTRSLIKEPL